MSDNKRIFKINTELFKIPHMTRKNRKPPLANGGKIKVKTPAKEQNNATLKRKLMKFIRNQHDQKIKDVPPPEIEFKSEFKESLDYLAKVAKKKDEEKETLIHPSIHNRTLKSYTQPKLHINPIDMNPMNNPIQMPIMNPIQMPIMNPITMPIMNPTTMTNPISFNALPPQYGCLKGGSLPLYKNWKNITQKTNAIPPPLRVNPNPQIPFTIANPPSPLNPRPNKRKRTIRRTYKIGRSKIAPKVTVLVSNRTIRNNITTKTQLLKQVPIGEVRKYLIKNGFIKIGSIAPNDVLRKIYETATLICGDVTNHNPDNLLYNFMNGQETH